MSIKIKNQNQRRVITRLDSAKRRKGTNYQLEFDPQRCCEVHTCVCRCRTFEGKSNEKQLSDCGWQQSRLLGVFIVASDCLIGLPAPHWRAPQWESKTITNPGAQEQLHQVHSADLPWKWDRRESVDHKSQTTSHLPTPQARRGEVRCNWYRSTAPKPSEVCRLNCVSYREATKMRAGQNIYQTQRDMTARGRVKTKSEIPPRVLCRNPQWDRWLFYVLSRLWVQLMGQEAERKMNCIAMHLYCIFFT